MATSTLDLNVKPATAAEIIKLTNNYLESLGIPISSQSLNTRERSAYHRYIRSHLQEYHLSERELKKLAEYLHIEWFDRDHSIPQSFIASLSLEHEGIKYTNPNDHQEFTIFCSSKSIFGVKCVLKHTQKGYQDPTYFTHFVPSLAIVKSNYYEALKPISQKIERLSPKKRDEILRFHAQRTVNSPLNREYKDKGMNLTELQIIHLFFNLYMPGCNGICQNCFKLSLPIEGFGARWLSKTPQHTEIRLSTPKLNSYDAHRVLYVTHEFIDKDLLYVAFEGIRYIPRQDDKGEIIESQVMVDERPKPQVYSQATHKLVEREPAIHIPYDIYNNYYLDIIQSIPNLTNHKFLICKCQK